MAGVRRTWDKDHFKEKALERLEKGDNYDDERVASAKSKFRPKEEFRAAEDGAQGPVGSARAFLSARTEKIDLDSKVGKTEVIKPTEVLTASGAGWFCEVCNCLLKDSASYLDHVNGKRHQRALGFSMRVERASVDSVRDRLKTAARKISDISEAPVLSAQDEYDEKLRLQSISDEKLKKSKKEKAASLKKEKEEVEMESIDPEIAALMGFGGFK